VDEEMMKRALAAQLRRPGAAAEALRARAMAAAVQALRGGATFRKAAEAAGVDVRTIHQWRRKSPAFAAACEAAVGESDAPTLVVPRGGQAEYQLQKSGRRHRFTPERRAIFLEHFAATCDVRASAAAAEVAVCTVYHHRRTDPDFDSEWRAAKLQSYEYLEAELIRQKLAALERMRQRKDAVPEELAKDFDQALALLREHKRAEAGGRAKAGRGQTRWDFDRALDRLEKGLRAFGVRIEREEGEDEGGAS
jgi:hypothetical protein